MSQKPVALTTQSTDLQTVSLRELPRSTILDAIRLRAPTDEAEILRRANVCLANYYDPDLDPETKAGVRESFVRALAAFPLWAVLRAFDTWERQHKRRPSPAEVVMLAEREIEPMTSEIKRRDDLERQKAEYLIEQQRARPSKEAAQEIMARAGFTPQRMQAVRAAPMANSFDEAVTIQTSGALGPLSASIRAALDADPAVQRARAAE